jgi:hypothetical protein
MQAITLVREPDAADERVKEVYRDLKESLRTSVVNVLFQAYAANPRFLDYTWRRLRPSMLAPPFIEQARRIADVADRSIEGWPISDHAAILHSRNYGDNDLRKLREIVQLFHGINPKLLIITNAVRVALSGEPIGGVGVPHPQKLVDRDKLVRDLRGLMVTLVEEREAPLRVRMIYEDIQRATGLPFVNTDYRAMGSYPDWLEVFWGDCKPLMQDPRYREATARLDAAAREAARLLPYPLYMNADAFSDMAEVNEVFCNLLPGLLVNIAIARRGLGPEPQG